MNMEREHRNSPLFRFAALFALALTFAQPALAQGELATAPQGAKLSASASVTIRIVIRESVRMDASQLAGEVASRDRRSPPQQRQVDLLDGMQMVTLTRP